MLIGCVVDWKGNKNFDVCSIKQDIEFYNERNFNPITNGKLNCYKINKNLKDHSKLYNIINTCYRTFYSFNLPNEECSLSI